MEFLAVEVASRCPFCSGAMEILEDEKYVWLGCRRCLRYVKRDKRELTRRYVNYKRRFFNWRRLMAELYAAYRR